jgi:predicted RNase H-like HicB family nuclease
MGKNHSSARDRLKQPYARILVPEEDGSYSAEILEFPGCHAEGDTPDEAIANLEGAAVSWIEAAVEQEQDIPDPLAVYGYSGKINLRIPRSLHRQAARFAQKEDVSLNQFFACAIAARVGAEDLCDRLVERIKGYLAPVVSTVQILQVVGVPFESTASPISFDWAFDKQFSCVQIENAGPVITSIGGSLPQKVVADG